MQIIFLYSWGFKNVKILGVNSYRFKNVNVNAVRVGIKRGAFPYACAELTNKIA